MKRMLPHCRFRCSVNDIRQNRWRAHLRSTGPAGCPVTEQRVVSRCTPAVDRDLHGCRVVCRWWRLARARAWRRRRHSDQRSPCGTVRRGRTMSVVHRCWISLQISGSRPAGVWSRATARTWSTPRFTSAVRRCGVAAVDLVAGRPGGGDSGVQCPVDHAGRECGFRGEAGGVGYSCGLSGVVIMWREKGWAGSRSGWYLPVDRDTVRGGETHERCIRVGALPLAAVRRLTQVSPGAPR